MFIPLAYIFFTLMGGVKVHAKKDPKHPGYDKHRDTSVDLLKKFRGPFEDSAPFVIPEGSVFFIDEHLWHVYEHNGSVVDKLSRGLRGGVPLNHTLKPSSVMSVNNTLILLWIAPHYFHIMIESLLMLYTLEIHNFLAAYPHATILCPFDDVLNRDLQYLLHVFRINFKFSNFIKASRGVLYKIPAPYHLIIPKDVVLTSNLEIHQFVVRSLRRRLPYHGLFPWLPPPSRWLYLTRGNIRRHVINEDLLLKALQQQNIQFEVVNPGLMSIKDQAELFSQAKIVLGPHGSAMTSLIFSSTGLILIELYTRSNIFQAAKYLYDIQLHYHLLINDTNLDGTQSNLFVSNISMLVFQIRAILIENNVILP